MFTGEETTYLKRETEKVLRRKLPENIRIEEGPGLSVREDGSGIILRAESKTALMRGLMRYLQEKEEGAAFVSVTEEKHFRSCGAFLDFSRNGVMTVEACKRFVASCAVLGLDTVVLYTEDTFEVPEYRYMGYLRGRLSQAEIREIDDYAFSLGVEIVPCIQTLAHLGNFLQWKENEHMKDQPTIVLIDDEDVYRFIDAQIHVMRSCVRSHRLHIGMDEAHSVGLGRYYAKHGPTDRFTLLNRHLKRCVELCAAHDFHPIMWSDMFFRLGSKTGDYYDKEAVIPQQVIDEIPDVDLCYWDYYNVDEDMIEHMLSEHERMGDHTVYAGGVWTWSGFLPHTQITQDTMEKGLRHCMEHKTQTVLATTWGDDGNETDPFLALSQMAIFSEFCWRGRDCTHACIEKTGAFVTALPAEAYNAFGLLYPDRALKGEGKDIRWGKALIWCDLLYPLGPKKEDLPHILRQYETALRILEKYPEDDRCVYAAHVFRLGHKKAQILSVLRDRYIAGDREGVRRIAQEDIPALYALYEALRDAHKARWESVYKRNGWEVLALRYGGVMGRLMDAQDALTRWVDGKLSTVCELDEEPLDPTRKYGMQFYQVFVSPVFNL